MAELCDRSLTSSNLFVPVDILLNRIVLEVVKETKDYEKQKADPGYMALKKVRGSMPRATYESRIFRDLFNERSMLTFFRILFVLRESWVSSQIRKRSKISSRQSTNKSSRSKLRPWLSLPNLVDQSPHQSHPNLIFFLRARTVSPPPAPPSQRQLLRSIHRSLLQSCSRPRHSPHLLRLQQPIVLLCLPLLHR